MNIIINEVIKTNVLYTDKQPQSPRPEQNQYDDDNEDYSSDPDGDNNRGLITFVIIAFLLGGLYLIAHVLQTGI